MPYQPKTKLVGKEFSPLIVRRYSMPFLFFVAIISDDNLDDLDGVVDSFIKNVKIENSIQFFRQFSGGLVEVIGEKYTHSEGIAVVVCADKMVVSSLKGDFMNHLQCRLELYQILNLATNV